MIRKSLDLPLAVVRAFRGYAGLLRRGEPIQPERNSCAPAARLEGPPGHAGQEARAQRCEGDISAHERVGVAARETPAIRYQADVRRDKEYYRWMKKLIIKPSERNCPECMGVGFTMVDHPTRPGVKIYQECKECRGKGRTAAG